MFFGMCVCSRSDTGHLATLADMDALTDAIAALPFDARTHVRERMSARQDRSALATHRVARVWLTYHGLCMERYAVGALPEHWPDPVPELLTQACDLLAGAVDPASPDHANARVAWAHYERDIVRDSGV